MKRKPRILVVGSLVMDLICSTQRFPQSGETLIGMDFRTAPGGKGANQAMQAARLGAAVSMVGKVGNDDFGRQLRQSLADAGVNTDGITVSPDKASAVGNIQLETDEHGTANRILVIPGANMAITPEEVLYLEDMIADYDLVMLQLEIPMAVNVAVAQIAHGHGVPVMLNSAPSAPLPDELLACLTYISPNEHEASDLTGVSVTDIPSAQQAVECFFQKGVKNVIITMGSQGAVFADKEQFLSGPCVDYGRVVDPTAAGDSFVAAFCTAICQGDTPAQALLFANHTAGITVSRMGAQPSLPTLDEVTAFMAQNGHEVAWATGEKEFAPALDTFAAAIKTAVDSTLPLMTEETFLPAAELIWAAQETGNRIHITGIGKPAHIAGYMASLMSSTGTPTYFLHGTEAVHGSCGQLTPGDVVICISNSGETAELKATAMAVRRNGCKVIAVTGNPDSWLATFADAHLTAAIAAEGGPLNRAPRASILVETLVLQGLSVVLQQRRAITPQEYVLRHPGGALGQLRENEK